MRPPTKILTLAEIQELWYADGAKLRWRITTRNGLRKAGHEAGGPCPDGYVVVTWKKKPYRVHRIMYQLHNNCELGSHEWIDHIDRDRANNAGENLRIATTAQNAMNRTAYRNGTSGHKCIGHRYIAEEDVHIWKVHVRGNGREIQHRFPYTEAGLSAAILCRNQALKMLHDSFSRSE